MPPKTLQARTSAHSIEKYMKTEYDAYAAFLASRQGGKGTPLFYALCYALGAERALIYKALGTHFWRGGGFMPDPAKMRFYCVTNP